MAQSRDQQGTGHHPHKSTEEPWPHTKDEGTHARQLAERRQPMAARTVARGRGQPRPLAGQQRQ